MNGYYYSDLVGPKRADVQFQYIQKQGNCCAICGRTEWDIRAANVNYKRKHVWRLDHCHTSGRTRGVLCDRCNTGLGHFNDNDELLMKACQYVRDHRLG